MGQEGSREHQYDHPESAVIDPKTRKQMERDLREIRLRIRTFRARSGTEEICSSLYASWRKEKVGIEETWMKLSLPGRRALITDVRERVLVRARILHSVIAPKLVHPAQKIKVVRTLMEKCAFELFDTSIVYGDESLLLLIEDILEKQGGGSDIPFGLLFEVNNCFQVNEEASDVPSLVTEGEDLNELEDKKAKEMMTKNSSDQSLQSTDQSLQLSRSTNSLQQYYSVNDRSRNKRKSYHSQSISTLLSFIPSVGLDPVSRKHLTMELLMEMRHAFLVHFAILVFSELFDDTPKVLYKYEYDSGSDTDVGQNETDFEDEDDDGEEEESTGSSESSEKQ